MVRRIHVCQSIEGALRNWSKRDWKSLAKSNGITADEAMDYFWEQHAMGRKVLPIGEPCEGFSYQDGCPGHETSQVES